MKNLLLINIIIILFISFLFNSCSKDETKNLDSSDSTTIVDKKDNEEESKFFFSLSNPIFVYGSEYSLMKVLMKDEDYQNELHKRAGYLSELCTNILFYDLSNDEYKLLFNKPVNILSIDYPSDEKQKAQKYILYIVINEDSNSDNKLFDNDNSAIFISELNGNNLIQITKSDLDVTFYKKLSKNKLLIGTSIPDKNLPKDKWSQKILLYDISTNKIIDNRFDDMLEKSKQIFKSL
ncbi:MAG: hypothetical protein COW71_01620 [Ignavibacteriales bacterium CG18_big_fil_WC_8_21_14_2_50_31_20]|nr:MAG: hypothetical protein COW71_01620 [Ignavibacteriales bacterium CG18_big_fil_WC_8_21_14_2_50_31_20]